MKTKRLRGSKKYWLVVAKQAELQSEAPPPFPKRWLAVHFIDHRVEGWDGWRLLEVAVTAEVRP